MKKQKVTIPRKDMGSIEVDAFVRDGEYVGVMRPLEKDGTPGKSGWCLVHLSTGMRLGSLWFVTREKAIAFVSKMSPTADCWRDAKGRKDDSATVECFKHFQTAYAAHRDAA